MMQIGNNYIIETKGLEFGYGNKEMLLKDVSLKVERGSIYGFLGPNGAGKTTMIRLLLGLLKSRSGTINLFGKDFLKDRLQILSKTGALIEQPSLYEHLSGSDNLEITRQLKRADKERVKEVLGIVKLEAAADKKVKAYSLGMKQRLGIAIALVGQPELLILDEPVNGLDPSGIMDMRELLKTVNQKFGTTIFLSSHLISEIEKVVTHIGIINMGALVFQGTINELRNLKDAEVNLHIEVDDISKAVDTLKQNYKAVEGEGKINVVFHSKEQVNQIIQQLVSNNIKIFEAVIQENDLEHLFLDITKDSLLH